MAYARDEFDENEDDLRGTLADRLRGQYAAEEPTPPLGEAGGGGSAPLEAAPFNEAPTGGTGQEQTYQPQVEPDRSTGPAVAAPQGPLPYSATLPQGNSPAELAALNQSLGFGGGGQAAPTGGGDPVAFIREWQQSHPSSSGFGPLAQALQQKFGITPWMYGNTPSGNEINLNGQKYKVVGAEGTPGQYWYQPGMDDSGPPMAQQGLTNYQPRAQAYTPFSIGGVTAPQGLWGADFTSQLRQILMARLAAAGRPVDPNDPGITEPLSAARNEATRGTEQERARLAERAYAQGGLNTDLIGQQIQQSNERNAVGLGTLRANLISKEIESRKSELQNLLQMAFASGDAEASREIQMQIAQLNAMLQQEGFQVQREGIGANLAINAANQNRAAVGY